MESSTPNFENIVFLYACKKRKILDVKSDWFKSKHLQLLVKLTKIFYKNFQDFPFDLESDDPSINQIEELVRRSPKNFVIDPNYTEQQNIESFLSNCSIIIKSKIKSYSEKFVRESCTGWLDYQEFNARLANAIEYQRTQIITPQNVGELISKTKQIINGSKSFAEDDEMLLSFYDAINHKQPTLANLRNSGYRSFNLWASGDSNGGFEDGTLTIFVGESNIGKSIVLANLASNFILNGENVLLLSNEMKMDKIYKRIGSNLLNIDMGSYRDFSNDTGKLSIYLKELRENNNQNLMPMGDLLGQRYSRLSPNKITDIKHKHEDKSGQKIGVIILDYFTDLHNDHGYSMSNAYESYAYHKSNSVDLFNIANEESVAVITAHQLGKKGYGLDDLDLTMLGESSGIQHKTDNVWGIIQPPEMKIARKYIFKNMKGRESEYKDYKAEFSIDYNYMRLKDTGNMLDPSTYTV
jgi:hypothetical protein